MLLLHGFPQCWWTWRKVIEPLADAGHRVAALDLRGFGGSDRPLLVHYLWHMQEKTLVEVNSLSLTHHNHT